MTRVEEMKSLTEDIIASSETRAKAVNDLVSETHEMVEGFNEDRKKMSSEQGKQLAGFCDELSKSVKSSQESVRKSLQQITKERAEQTKELREELKKGAQGLASGVKETLKEFDQSHAKMTQSMKKDLGQFVAHISSSVKGILGDAAQLVNGFHEESQGAKKAWNHMVAHLAKAQGDGFSSLLAVEGSENVTTAKEGILAKFKTKMGKKKKK